MSREVWSTYSVNDHLHPRNFAADVMLFDRLVFPVPEEAIYPSPYVIYDPGLPMEWRRDELEWERWQREGWQPDEQQEWLEILAPVVRKMPWKEEVERAERYSTALANAASGQLGDQAFEATRMALTQGLPAYVTGVASLGPRYRSFDDFCAEARLDRQEGTTPLPGRALMDVIAAVT